MVVRPNHLRFDLFCCPNPRIMAVYTLKRIQRLPISVEEAWAFFQVAEPEFDRVSVRCGRQFVHQRITPRRVWPMTSTGSSLPNRRSAACSSSAWAGASSRISSRGEIPASKAVIFVFSPAES